MGILVKNSDFELLWNEPYPSIEFDNSSYSLAGEEGTELEATFSITDNNSEDVTDQCTITFNNEYVTIEDGKFTCEGLEVGTYETTATATYSYKSATVTATATINISVTEIQPTSISFGSESYSMNGNEYAALSTQFTVSDNLGNDVTALSSYSFEPNDKGLYADGGYFKVDSATAGIYSITVTATYGQLTNTATISMAVVDYPDSISFDSNSYSMSGTEGDTITQSFTITDDLSHDVTSNCSYSLSPNNTGLTASNGTFDASSVAEGTYSVTVTATYQSGNGRTLTATATVAMEIESASFANKYFTTEALESGTFTLSVGASVNGTYMTSVSYSTDDGTTWTTTNMDSTAQTITTPTIAQGGKVLWKGVGTQMFVDWSNNCVFSSTGNFNVSGNIMSLLHGDNFANITSFNSKPKVFAMLFDSCTTLINAKDLILPATTLTEWCYRQMFYQDTNLLTAPTISATEINDVYENQSCNSMFESCTSLTTSPILSVIILKNDCFINMFKGCTNLSSITMLATTSASSSLSKWVDGVAASGTFTKDASMTSLPSGVSGIPSGWTVVDYSE